ncbi:MAG: hypothetical protein HOY75_13385 [Streptomyces sp.]|nr:hypothetical protein [Streptomyces sp.]
MTPYERLMAEEIPTRPPPPAKPVSEPWTPEEQARHWADLNAALADWHWHDDTRVGQRRRHLRLLRETDAA